MKNETAVWFGAAVEAAEGIAAEAEATGERVAIGYENTPAAIMLASNCACCGKALVDATSVETGVGPDCREMHGFAEAQGAPDLIRFAAILGEGAFEGEDPRAIANQLTYRIAAKQTGADVQKYTAAIHALGYTKLAERIAKRVGAVYVTEVDGLLEVKAPFSYEFNAEIRNVRGQRWVPAKKVRTVPKSARAGLWAALKASFPKGTLVVGSLRIATL